MRKQVVHISVHQTSKVIAAMHAAMMTVLLVLPVVLGHWFHGQIMSGILMLLFVPFFMWLFMYIGYVIACWFYNLVVPWVGGIEIEVADIKLQTEQPVKTSEESAEHPEQRDAVSKKDEPL